MAGLAAAACRPEASAFTSKVDGLPSMVPQNPKRSSWADSKRSEPVLSRRDPRIAMTGNDASLLLELEREGAHSAHRGSTGGRPGVNADSWPAFIGYTLERLRREIEPVIPSEFLRFLSCWQHVDEDYRLEGPRGVSEVLSQLAGFEAGRPGHGRAMCLGLGVRCATIAWSGSMS